ncbi:uncharacterized protein LOC114425408 [Glycine soja]|uniref:uncharacterized protein LOC114425408 n=1 Tax=Glycine soja TaxID=3848 RepID=UPI00104028DC|nr:uncharacterized protein LOC114425408 [Glycine soja]
MALNKHPNAWFAKFHNIVSKLGFSSNGHDSAHFTRKRKRGLTGSKIERTPLEPNVRFTPQDGTLLLDISSVVHLVSQFMKVLCTTHYVVVLRIIRYVKGTLFYSLYYSVASPLTLQAYSGVDWTGDPINRRSTTSLWIFLGDSLIS